MALADDLRAAKALIDTPETWSKDPGEFGKCYCVVTSLGSGLNLHYAEPTRYLAAIDALVDAGAFEDVEALISFNDDPATAHADIMALFDRAIAKAEGGAP